MKMKFLALLLAAFGDFAGAEEAKIGSTPITLTQPLGQCDVTNTKGKEAAAISKTRELIRLGGNELLAAYVDCQQLTSYRSGKLEAFTDFAQFQAASKFLTTIFPRDSLAKLCAAARTKTDQYVAELLQKHGSDIERTHGIKIQGTKFLGVLREEPTVCYTGQLQKVTADDGYESLVAAVVAIIWLKGKIFSYQIYTTYSDKDTFSALLQKHQANVAALIAANGG